MKKVLSIFLSALLFISSTGFTVSNHYCGGLLEKIEIGFSGEKLVCEMSKMEVVCEKHPSSEKMEKASCCSNEYINFSIEDNFEIAKVEEKDISHTFLIAYSFVNAGYFFVDQQKDFNLLLYTPPLLERDIPVLVQSFLI